MSVLEELPVVVVGAGPVGLAAAAHLHERELPFLVLEAGDTAGAAVRRWGHVRLFSPWRYDVDPAARRLLDDAGWVAPAEDALPTGAELVADHLQPLAELPQLKPRLRYGARVTAISRLGLDRLRTPGRDRTPFLIRLADGEELLARAVIDASGTWGTPNVLGASGLPAHGETDVAAYLEHALPDVLGADRGRFAGRHTLVVGAGHSAANTLLSLAELAAAAPGTEVTWAIRSTSPARAYGGGDADELPARGALGSRLREHVDAGRIRLLTGCSVHALTPTSPGPTPTPTSAGSAPAPTSAGPTPTPTSTGSAPGGGRVAVSFRRSDGGTESVTVDRIVAATGFRPDHSIAAELRLDLDPIMGATRALAPLIDPNEHSCGTVPPHGVDELAHPEVGYYAVGMKSYGRAPTFLMATGYEQVRSVVAALAGDWAAARDVQLDLPETGVCTSDPADSTGAGSCCGPTPTGPPVDSPATSMPPAPLPLVSLDTPTSGPSAGCCATPPPRH
ncbi:NAD(P)-binding protein [Micromonospora sp. WMMD882]|uniref:NAD(P)-binding protein n=1 Tax=Micromonospora sp. WMMD882 TaxID=3015151 RepID=UPI00248C044F|nr:NAD(P)-binding protein [Micromonospora sp. WMMD882]WBB78653.1 NAD(P)-binding protein [Micromonospora sp. WMMD882]